MRPIAPRTGAPEIMVAEEQPEYLPLCAAVYVQMNQDGTKTPLYLMRYTLTATERAAVAGGADLYLHMVGGVAPHSLTVGEPAWCAEVTQEPEATHE